MALVFRFVLNVADFDSVVAFYRDAPSAPAAQPWGHYSFSGRDPVGLETVCFADISGQV